MEKDIHILRHGRLGEGKFEKQVEITRIEHHFVREWELKRQNFSSLLAMSHVLNASTSRPLHSLLQTPCDAEDFLSME